MFYDLSPQYGVTPGSTQCLVDSPSPVGWDDGSHDVVTEAMNGVRRIGTGPGGCAVEDKYRGSAQVADFVKSADDSRNPDGIGRSHRDDRISAAQDFASRALALL